MKRYTKDPIWMRWLGVLVGCVALVFAALFVVVIVKYQFNRVAAGLAAASIFFGWFAWNCFDDDV